MATPDRIANIDAVRGIAVLGILAVNAIAFAWPMDAMMALAHLPMSIDGVLQGHDRIAAWAMETFFTDKFRTLFCMLFGVSIFIIGGARSDSVKGHQLRRRLFWLAVFGLVHGIVFWFGDILLVYAVVGLLVMLMRDIPAKILIIIGAAITAALMIIQAGLGLLLPVMPTELASAFEGHGEVTRLSLMADVATMKDGPFSAFFFNLKSWLLVQTLSLTILLPALFALMVLGMGLFKAGFFHGRMPAYVYIGLITVGMAALALKGWAAWLESGVAPEQLPSRGLNVVGSSLAVLISLAYASIIIKLPVLFIWARAVGRMAFTTYLFQTLTMSTLFYMPWGPKLYGTLSPAQICTVVFAVWIAQILFAHLWLKFFRWGPMEWLWRSLTVAKRLPLRKSAA